MMKALGKRKEIPRATGPNRRLRRLMASQRVVLTDNDIHHLRKEWMDKINDLVSGIPLELPPLREVNREINLVDPVKRIRYRLPKCPEHFCEDLSAKIERYTTAEWWVPAVAHQAVPMLCVPKKNRTLHTEEEWYAPYHFRSARAEREHSEGRHALPRPGYHQK
jgi:hypothetical protein